MDILINNFHTTYNTFLDLSKTNSLYNSHIEDLEIIIAKFEIAINKIVSLSQGRKSNICSANNILEYMKIRDSMCEKVDYIRLETVEYNRMISD